MSKKEAQQKAKEIEEDLKDLKAPSAVSFEVWSELLKLSVRERKSEKRDKKWPKDQKS